MPTKLSLQDLIDEMEMQSEENITFVNLKTGELVLVQQYFLRDAEDGEDFDHLPEWQQEQMKIAIDILEHEDSYAEIPNEFEIHEYDMMEKFCFTVEESIKGDKLLNAIRGRGAFRRFKDKVSDLGLEEQWFAYRNACYRKIAVDFCERNNLSYEE